MNKAASELGKMARGVPKSFSPEELARRTERIQEVNRRKKAAKVDPKPKKRKS